jgi:hypothetical protein
VGGRQGLCQEAAGLTRLKKREEPACGARSDAGGIPESSRRSSEATPPEGRPPRRHPGRACQRPSMEQMLCHPSAGWAVFWTAFRRCRFAPPPYRCPEVINRLRAERVPQLKPGRLLITSPPAKTLGSRRMNSTSIPKQEY